MIASWSSALPHVFSTARFSVRLGILLGILLIPGHLWSPEYACGQSTETQQLSLEQGRNYVSLRVQPEDASLSAIFEGHLDQIYRVRDEKGRVYMPGNGVEQFSTWDPAESYKVYATDPFDVGVTGTPLSLTTAAVPLEKGGNLVPFLPADPQSVDDALASISETLLRVEGEEGNAYESGGASSSLDSLRAGEGYELYVDQPDTLLYTIDRSTLMEVLSLEGMQEGQHIHARGRDEPGDGGGGMFVVTNSACETDGATCFIFDENLTSVSRTFESGNFGQDKELPDLQNTDISWRSFEVRYGPDPEDIVHNIHLHGHFLRVNSIVPTLDTETGAITDRGAGGGRLTRLENQVGYDFDDDPNGRNGKFTYNYSHTNDNRRLERKGVTNSVKPEWWGAPKADPNNPQEIDPYLRWAATKAQELRDQKGLSEVFIDFEGTYYYLHAALLPAFVKARGVGSLDHDANMPSKFQDDYTRATMRLLPGEGLYWNKSSYDRFSDSDRKRLVEGMSLTRARPFRNLYQSEGWAYKRMKFDGNVRNNMQVFNNLGDYDNPITQLADGGSWVSWYTVAIDSKNWKDGATMTFEDVNVVDMAGAGISHTSVPDGLNLQYETVGTLGVYHARRNHNIYGLTGNISNVTLQGQFHGAMLTLDGRVDGVQNYSDFTIKNLEDGQFSYNTVIGIRGRDFPDAGDATLDNFAIDLRNESFQSPNGQLRVIRNDRSGTNISNVTIEGPTSYDVFPQIFRGKSDNDQRGNLKSITYTDNGIPANVDVDQRNTLYKNITVQTASGVSGTKNILPINFKLESSDHGVPRQHRVVIKDLTYERSYDRLGAFGAGAEGDVHPKDIFIIGGQINNDTGVLTNGNGPTDARVRIFLEDYTFNMRTNDGYHSPLSPDQLVERFGNKAQKTGIRCRNCTGDFGGGDTRPSDNSGTFTTDASHEEQDFVDIDPNLLSHPWARSATVTSGTPSVTGVDAIDQNGNIVNDPPFDQRDDLQKHDIRVQLDQPISEGETITIDWTARVTPLSDYQTTGLFVAREVERNRKTTFQSGGGPFTIDLRGIMATQESWDPITYTASSGNTSVVTANVQSDNYTLQLTEQGTGTATITVTGEIAGVGTTTTTFEVTVE